MEQDGGDQAAAWAALLACGGVGEVRALPAPKDGSATLLSVTPADAGAHLAKVSVVGKWVPASAGMTGGRPILRYLPSPRSS